MSHRTCECIGNCTCEERTYYRYYDTPEGCDIPKKVGVLARYAAATGFIMGSFDVLMYSHATGFSKVMKRYMYHTVPLVAMGATFPIVANGLQLLREENDHWNYFFGGLACGPIAGAYLGSKLAVLTAGLALGAIAMVKKEALVKGVALMPPLYSYRKKGYLPSDKNDYSLVKDPKKDLVHTCEKKNVAK